MDLFILFFYFFCIDPHGCIKKIKNKKFVIENLFKKKINFTILFFTTQNLFKYQVVKCIIISIYF